MTEDRDPREGFIAYQPPSPFLQRLGEYYSNDSSGNPVLGFRIEAHHLNHHGVAHGGLIASLADNALGTLASRVANSGVVTVHLSIDYLGPIEAGSWLEVTPVVDRAGRRTLFLSCIGTVRGEGVFKANAIFNAITRPTAATSDSGQEIG